MLSCENNGISISFDLHQLCTRANSFSIGIILHKDFKLLQGRIIRTHPSQLIHTGSLEVVITPIKGLQMTATSHAALIVDYRVTSAKAINHLAFIPLMTTWFLTINFLGILVACAPLSTEVISKERGSTLYVVAFVQAATLGLRDTLSAAKQEALVTDAGLYTASFALCGSLWVFTGGRAGIPAELIMAVLWARGQS